MSLYKSGFVYKTKTFIRFWSRKSFFLKKIFWMRNEFASGLIDNYSFLLRNFYFLPFFTNKEIKTIFVSCSCTFSSFFINEGKKCKINLSLKSNLVGHFETLFGSKQTNFERTWMSEPDFLARENCFGSKETKTIIVFRARLKMSTEVTF